MKKAFLPYGEITNTIYNKMFEINGKNCKSCERNAIMSILSHNIEYAF